MKRPSFQFYPGDWTANPNLRRCSFAERGIWMELMCLMHDQDEYGVLRWPLKEIAQAIGCKVSDLIALKRKGVLKGADSGSVEPFVYVPRSGRKDGDPVTLVDTQEGPLWYSSRMVKDEYVRTVRGDCNTPKGAPKQPPKHPPKPSPKPPFGESNGAPFGPRGSSSSSSTSVERDPTDVESLSERDPTLGENPGFPSPALPITGVDETFDDDGRVVSLEAVSCSPAAKVCMALRSVGVGSVNPAHPTLRALVDAGADVAEFMGFVEKAQEAAPGREFPYLLAAVANERKKARDLVGTLTRGRLPTKQESLEARNRAVAEEFLRERGL